MEYVRMYLYLYNLLTSQRTKLIFVDVQPLRYTIENPIDGFMDSPPSRGFFRQSLKALKFLHERLQLTHTEPWSGSKTWVFTRRNQRCRQLVYITPWRDFVKTKMWRVWYISKIGHAAMLGISKIHHNRELRWILMEPFPCHWQDFDADWNVSTNLFL